MTAGNASGVNDGAAALIIASEKAALEHNLKPRARILASSTSGVEPRIMGYGPVPSVKKLLDLSKIRLDEIGVIEINEAFAMVTMLAMKAHGLDHSKVNVHGGACAQGHPIGSTGSRIIVTLMHAMHHYGKGRGVAALCIGGGEATAVAIEKC